MHNNTTLEDVFNIKHTKEKGSERKVTVKINEAGDADSSAAFAMLQILDNKGINISKHIRMLLAMEFNGTYLVPPEKAVLASNSDGVHYVANVNKPAMNEVMDVVKPIVEKIVEPVVDIMDEIEIPNLEDTIPESKSIGFAPPPTLDDF